MVSMLIWVVVLAASVASVCVTVALGAEGAHLGATALVSLGIVAAAVHEHRGVELAGGSEMKLAATASRYIGLLWAWSGIATYVVYAFLLDWPLWVTAVMAMFTITGLSLFVAFILDREADAEQPDAKAALMAGLLIKGQFALGAVLLGILIALRHAPETMMGGGHRWVALNLAAGTAAALLTFTGYLVLQAPNTAAEQPSAA